MNASDPRVNPYHPDHEHDWHGDYDDGHYLGDVCRCGATRRARLLISGCGADCGQVVNRAERHIVVALSTEQVETDGTRTVEGGAEAAVYHLMCAPDVQAALAPAPPAAPPAPPTLQLQELLQDTYSASRLLRTSTVPRDRALARVLLGVRAQLVSAQQDGRPLGLLPTWTRKLVDVIASEEEGP